MNHATQMVIRMEEYTNIVIEMKRYIKKPPTFEAMQWLPGTDKQREFEMMVFKLGYCIQRRESPRGTDDVLLINIHNPNLKLTLRNRDWLVLTGGDHNEVIVVSDWSFTREYVLAEEDSEPF